MGESPGKIGSQCRHAAHLQTHSNAYAERFVRSIKQSCLERMILFGEDSLRKAVHEFVAHYQQERNHQGLANRLISPEASHLAAGVVQRRQRPGGMLSYYYRVAA